MNATTATNKFIQGEKLDFEELRSMVAKETDRRELSMLLTLLELEHPDKISRLSHATQILKQRNLHTFNKKLITI